MRPFRELVKPNSTFKMDKTLEDLFEKSKQKLVLLVEEGITSFDLNKTTCIQTDFSREGIGYFLLQKHCTCDTAKAPVCCKDGWRLVFAGSRFLSDAESRYSTTEGEALAVQWGLHHSRLFTLGCDKLIVITDHRPLLGIFGDRDLHKIANPRLCNLKQKTLLHRFDMYYNPGKWNRAADAVSRYPIGTAGSNFEDDSKWVHGITEYTNLKAIRQSTDSCLFGPPETEMMSIQIKMQLGAITDPSEGIMVSPDQLDKASEEDPVLEKLRKNILQGSPETMRDTDPSIHKYWNVRNSLSISGHTIFMNDRIVIPHVYKAKMLKHLHVAHQGVSSMSNRANSSLYWPGMHKDIRNTRWNCMKCNEVAPSYSKEPLKPTLIPQYPFQHVALDYMEYAGHSYLVYVDRYSGRVVNDVPFSYTSINTGPHKGVSRNVRHVWSPRNTRLRWGASI